MKNFDIKDLTPEMCAEIKACESTDALKAYFASKGISVPDNKLEDIKNLSENFTEIDADTLEAVSGGCESPYSNDTCACHTASQDLQL